MKKKRLTDAELQGINNEVKIIIKKMKEKVVVTEQPESELKDKEIVVGLESEGEPVMLKEWKLVVEHLLCDLNKKTTSTMKTKIIITKMMSLLPKTLKKLVN